ncbi:MAG: DinB family protein [Ignavibacteria bacterium]|jgi:hypothetical protein
MENRSEALVLLSVYENVRGLTKFFISKLGDTDINHVFEVNGIKLNTIQWLIAHLAWTENELIVKAVGNDDINLPWLEEYGFGSVPAEIKTRPDLETLLKVLDSTHQRAVKILSGLTAEDLDSDNHLNFSFAGSKCKRNLIIHAIRHEPMHIGQLTWAMKLSDIKTF